MWSDGLHLSSRSVRNMSLSSLLDWEKSDSYEVIVFAPGYASPSEIIVPVWMWCVLQPHAVLLLDEIV